METSEEQTLREWVTPTFECVPLNEALWEIGVGTDATGHTWTGS